MKNLLGVYCEWGRDAKDTYAKMTMDKDVKNLVEGYENYIGGDVKVQKNPGDPGTILSKSNLD